MPATVFIHLSKNEYSDIFYDRVRVPFVEQDPFYYLWFDLIPARMDNYTHHKMWDEIG